jgi:hypothetical protein
VFFAVGIILVGVGIDRMSWAGRGYKPSESLPSEEFNVIEPQGDTLNGPTDNREDYVRNAMTLGLKLL